MASTDIPIKIKIEPIDTAAVQAHVDAAIKRGDLRLELTGVYEIDNEHPFGFIVDRARYLVSYTVTEETLKIWIEPKACAHEYE